MKNEYGGLGDFPVANYESGDVDSYLESPETHIQHGAHNVPNSNLRLDRSKAREEDAAVLFVHQNGYVDPYNFDGV